MVRTELSISFGEKRGFNCQFLKSQFALQVVHWEQNVCPGILASHLMAGWWIEMCVCQMCVRFHVFCFSSCGLDFTCVLVFVVCVCKCVWYLLIQVTLVGSQCSFVPKRSTLIGRCGDAVHSE